MKVKVEVREQTIIGAKEPALDEIVLYVDGRCLFHLEQLDDNHWWMGIGDDKGQYVHAMLSTSRATIHVLWNNEGPKNGRLLIDGKAPAKQRGRLLGCTRMPHLGEEQPSPLPESASDTRTSRLKEKNP